MGWESHSQVQQDAVIHSMWHEPGYFVDLAANDWQKFSNSYSLELHDGWKGMCIEPNIKYWDGLLQRSCELVGVVVTDKEDELVHFALKDELGGVIDENTDNSHPQPETKSVEYASTTVGTIFSHFSVPKLIHYMSVDVEGAESMILSTFPFHEYKVYIFTIERPKSDVLRILEHQGYVEVGILGTFGDTCYLQRSTPDFWHILERGQRKVAEIAGDSTYFPLKNMKPIRTTNNHATGVRCPYYLLDKCTGLMPWDLSYERVVERIR
jgi:hypothetical protein